MATSVDVDAQRAIDRQKAQYTEVIRLLDRRRNTYAAISKLPNEVLSQIFVAFRALCDVDLFKDPKSYGRKHPVIEILVLSRICSHWRNVALSTPQLWATVTLTSAAWVTESIKRAKRTPLRFIFPPRGVSSLRSRRSADDSLPISRSLKRAEEIVLYCWDTAAQSFFSEGIAPDAEPHLPMLRRLVMVAFYDDPSLHPVTVQMHHFWTQGLPLLRSMELRSMLPSHFPLLPSLVHLVLDSVAPDHPITGLWLLNDALRNMPEIEHVEAGIIVCMGLNFLEPTSPLTPVTLPRLRRLILKSRDLEAAQLFTYLEIPHTASVSSVYYNDYGDIDASDYSYLQSLHARASSISAINSLHMQFKQSYGEDGYEYSLSVGQGEGASNVDSPLPSLHLQVEWVPYTMRNHITTLQFLPLHQIQHLNINHVRDDHIRVPWSSLLPLLIRLQTITVDHKPILFALSTKSSRSTQLPNPELRSVSIVDDFDMSADNARNWGSLVPVFRARSKHGVPIRELTVTNCNVTSGYLEPLKRFATVVWDGRKRGVTAADRMIRDMVIVREKRRCCMDSDCSLSDMDE